MTESLGTGAQDRPGTGSTVYFVTHEVPDGDGSLVTRVGRAIGCSSLRVRELPAMWVWPQGEPDRAQPMLHPTDSLFTAEQVRRVIDTDSGPLRYDHRPLDEIVRDPATNFQLTGLLGIVALERQLEHLTLGPSSPSN